MNGTLGDWEGKEEVAASAFIGLLVLMALTTIGGWARLAALRGCVRDAAAQLKNHLQRRHDLVLSLIHTVRALDPPHAGLLGPVATARQQATDAIGIPARAAAENELTWALHTLLAAAEADPGFWSTPAMGDMQEELRQNENQILAAGRCYNQQVMTLNVTIARLPYRWIARLTGFRPIEYFVLDEPPLPRAPHDE